MQKNQNKKLRLGNPLKATLLNLSKFNERKMPNLIRIARKFYFTNEIKHETDQKVWLMEGGGKYKQ